MKTIYEKHADKWEKAAHLDNHKSIACAVLAAILTIITLFMGYNLTNIG